MAYYIMVFLAGFAGSFHCIGMCGGFACALGHDPHGPAATALRQVLYNIGRLATYCFIGALVGAFGGAICTAQGADLVPPGAALDIAARTLAIVAGVLMICMALQFFGFPRVFRSGASGFGGSTFAAALRTLLRTRSRAAPLALGVFNGFLPCPLVYAFAAEAASTFRPWSGVQIMAAFALGTFPAMLMIGGLGPLLTPDWRQRGVWLAGTCILLLGLITLGRGILPLAMHATHVWTAGRSA